ERPKDEGKVTPFYKGGSGGIKATISIEEAIAIAKKEVPGEVVEAEYERGRYEIKILKDGKITDGRITEIYVDAKDGSIKRK
ncbi:MAG: PepSY domain-containing protein, partial [Deltaproteobacteria bacterium]